MFNWFQPKPWKLMYELQRTQRELRVANKAARNKRKLAKALHEANKEIIRLRNVLISKAVVPEQYVHSINEMPPNCE